MNGPWRLGPNGWVWDPPPRHPEPQQWEPKIRGRARESIWLVTGPHDPPPVRNLCTDAPCKVDWRAGDTKRRAYLDIARHRYLFLDTGEIRSGTVGGALRVFRYAGEVGEGQVGYA